MSDELKANIVQNVLDRKFSRANTDFANLMRYKAYAAIDDFKNSFKYVVHQKKEPEAEKTEPAKKETEKKEK